MTGPQIWDSGPGSDAYFSQLSQFNATRDKFYQNLLNGINQRVAPQQVTQTPTNSIQQQGAPVSSDWNDPDLLGAARFWGIPEDVARHMPKDALVAHINKLRQTVRPDESSFAHRAGAAADMLLAVPEMFGIGAGEALTGLVQHLPLIGPRLAALKGVHEADMYLRELEESVRSSTPESFQNVLSGVNVVGNIAATWFPAAGAWKIAGKPVGWVASPLVRAGTGTGAGAFAARAATGAVQGAGSGYLLDGGSDSPAGAVVGGAVLGAGGSALEPYIIAAASKLSNKFLNPAMLENYGPALPDRPLNRMEGARGQYGEVPAPFVPEGWDTRTMGPVPSREEWGQFQLNASQSLGRIAEQGRHSERQFFPSGYPFKGMNEQTAEVAALQMNKVNAIVESPVMPTIAKQVSPDDFSVAQALGASNPGGTSLIDGIADPGQFMYHYGEYAGGVSNPSRSIWGGANTLGDGLYFTSKPDPNIVPSLAMQNSAHSGPTLHPSWYENSSWKRFQVNSKVKLFDLEAPLDERVFKHVLENMDPEFADEFAAQRLNEGWKTNADMYHSQLDMDMGESADLSGFNGQLEELGFHGVKRTGQHSAKMGGGSFDEMNLFVKDPTQLIRHVPEQQSQARWNEVGHVGFAQRNGRLAAITSDQPITAEVLGEFEKHGMYSGQEVMTGGGNLAVVQSIAEDGTATLKYPYSSVEFTRHVGELSPSTASPGVHAVPNMWEHFKAYTEAQSLEAQAAMGGQLNPEQLAAIKTANTPHYMEQFLDEAGVAHEGDRARIKNYFNQQWVSEFADHAPAEALQNHVLRQEAAHAENIHPATPVGALDAAASAKGYVAIPDGEGGWRLRNVAPGVSGATSPVEISFSDLEAAQEHLRVLNRAQQNITPDTGVPLELAGSLYTEPTQLPNTNAQSIELIAKSIGRMTADAGGVPPVPPEDVALARASGNWGQLKNLWNSAAAFTPMRPRFAQISQAVRNIAGDDFGIAHDFDSLTNNLVMHHNIMHEPTNRLADILAPINTRRMINGEWMRVWQIGDDAARTAKAASLGWKPDEIQAMDHFSQLISDVAGEDVNPTLRKYVSTIAERQSIPELQATAWEEPATSEAAQAWKEYASDSNINVRELDPRRFGESFIRSVNWKKNMAPTFDPIMEKWKGYADGEGIKTVSSFVRNWMDVMKKGYTAEDDMALDTIHLLAQKMLGPSFSRQQARELINFGMNTSHSAYLGYRVHVMARDALQLFFAIPRAGGDLASVITKYTTDSAYRKLVWDESLNAGAIQLTMPHRVSPGALGGELEQASAGMTPEHMSKRMQMVGAVTSTIRDMVPDVLKGSSDSILKPLYLYGKQQELMRALVYRAGFEKGERALAAFRSAGAEADLQTLMGESGARTFDPAWQEEFKRIVSTGDDKRAASFLGRQLADATQFKYGASENPTIGRTMTGKLGMQFGSFQLQYLQYLRESLSNGTIADKSKVALMFGAVTAATQAASAETGWNFNYMNPFAIGFAGGPAVSMAEGFSKGVKSTADAFFNPDNQGIDRGLAAGGQALGAIAGAMNPTAGLYATISGLGSAINDSPMPGHAIGRLLVTGERGALPDILQTVHSVDLQPAPNPVRQGSWQLPQIPQMPAVYPFGAVPGQSGTRIQTPPATIPAPGGAAESYRPLPNEDENFIAFTARPQPGMASGYNVDDVKQLLMELKGVEQGGPPPVKARFFQQDDLQFLQTLTGVPVGQAVDLFRGFMRDKLSRSAHDSLSVPPGYDVQPNPGGGAFF